MKLDKIKFARLISFLGTLTNRDLDNDEIEWIDRMIDIDIEPVKTDKVPCEAVDELLKQIINPDGFISAIKTYRSLTGAGLKESKEAIERYRNVNSSDAPKYTKQQMLLDAIRIKLQNVKDVR
jgi:hypothetical protein